MDQASCVSRYLLISAISSGSRALRLKGARVRKTRAPRQRNSLHQACSAGIIGNTGCNDGEPVGGGVLAKAQGRGQQLAGTINQFVFGHIEKRKSELGQRRKIIIAGARTAQAESGTKAGKPGQA